MESAVSLFGDIEELKPERPELPAATGDEDILEKLKFEKELVGMYLSSHPLDTFSFEIQNFTSCQLGELQALITECNTTRKPAKVALAGQRLMMIPR